MNVTKYQTYMDLANKCRETAKLTTGLMQSIWLRNAIELENKARSLKIEDIVA